MKTLLLCAAAMAAMWASGGDPYDYKKTVQRRMAPASVTTNAAGNALVDFGREAFGFLELLPPPGAEGEYEVCLGELLKGGSVDMKPGATIRAARVKGRIAAGGGVHRVPLVPDRRNTTGGAEGGAIKIPPEHGVIMPFRYVEFAAAPFAVTKDSVRMVAVNYPIDMTASSFECDDPRLVKVYDFCKHSILATSFAGLYIDGDRERIPYEMDAYLNQLCEYAVHADYSLARASHEYLMVHPTWPTEWKQYSIRMAWTDWMWTGDTRSIAKFYDQLKDEKLLASYARTDGLLVTGGERARHSLTNACGLADIVDWPVSERDGFVFRPVNAVVNAFHYRNLMEMADIARALGKSADSERFSARARAFRAAYNKVFFDPARGVYRDGEGTDHAALHSSAAALAVGLVPPESMGRVADNCVARGMACSVGFAQHLLEGLFFAGRDREAVALMVSSGERSWLGMMDFGATITMESWSVRVKPNLDLNHPWGAVPLNIISRFVAGVEPLEPGFKKISIRPRLGGLRYVKATVPTAAGPVHVEVTPERLAFTAPAPVVATFGGRTATFPPGRHVMNAH
jgi:hypothetical protein